SCTHFIAVSKSTISPLRTPREGAWPTPRILIVPSVRLSPTTTQTFAVPISNPTNKSLLPINFLLFVLMNRNRPLDCRLVWRFRRSHGRRLRLRRTLHGRLPRGKCSSLRRIAHRHGL